MLAKAASKLAGWTMNTLVVGWLLVVVRSAKALHSVGTALDTTILPWRAFFLTPPMLALAHKPCSFARTYA